MDATPLHENIPLTHSARRRPFRLENLEDRCTPSTAAGSPDPSFGTEGSAFYPSSLLHKGFSAQTVVVQPDGGILVSGYAIRLTDPVPLFNEDFTVFRFTNSGQLDTTFGSGGVAQVGFDLGGNTASDSNNNADYLNAVAVQPDGRIILAGKAGVSPPRGSTSYSFAVARLTPDGNLDPTFGTGGKVTFTVSAAKYDEVNAIAIQPDGRIVLAGSNFYENSGVVESDFLAARLTANGQIDTTFHGTGSIVVPFDFSPPFLTNQADNLIDYATVSAVAVQPDGEIVLAGAAAYAIAPPLPPGSIGLGHVIGTLTQFAVSRLTSDGELDTGFGDGGRTLVPFSGVGSEDSKANAVGILPDGRIILAGEVSDQVNTAAGQTTVNYDVAAVRLTPSGKPDPTYGTSGWTTLNNGVGQREEAATVGADGRVVFVGPVVGRLTIDGNQDTEYGGTPGPNVAIPDPRFVAFSGGNIIANSARNDQVYRLLGAAIPYPIPAGATPVGGSPDGAVQVLTPSGGTVQPGVSTNPFPGFTGTVRTTTADVNGDGVPDLIAAAGPGGGPAVAVIDGKTGADLARFFAFEPTFTGGLYVTAADLTGDDKADLVVTPDQGGGPVVAAYDGAGLTAGKGSAAQIGRFYGIADPAFRGGARPALGDVNGDGSPDLIVSAGYLGGPRVAVFDGKGVSAGNPNPGRLVPDFFAFEDTLRNGAFVAAGDVDADGKADLIFGGGPGGGPRVRVISGAKLLAAGSFATLDAIAGSAQLANFFAGDSSLRGGVHVAARDINGDGKADVITGSGDGEVSQVRVYLSANVLANPTPTPDQTLDPFGASLPTGVFVG